MFRQAQTATARIFVVGNSHTAAMARALDASGPPEGTVFSICNINKMWDRLQDPKTPNLAALIVALYREAMGRAGADLFVSRLGGNEHSILGTLDGPRPFDFAWGEEPLLPGREQVSLGFIRAAMEQKVGGALRHLGEIGQKLACPIVVMEAPPPISDDAYVAEYLDKFFQAETSPPRVAPAPLRHKMWRLQCQAAAACTCDAGATYLPSPSLVFDEDGYLAPAYWGKDATHGNTAYGQAINNYVAAYAGDRTARVARHA